jgi:hypothetical protein
MLMDSAGFVLFVDLDTLGDVCVCLVMWHWKNLQRFVSPSFGHHA